MVGATSRVSNGVERPVQLIAPPAAGTRRLVFGRYQGQTIMVGDIAVHVIRAGHHVRLAIDAPPAVRVDRLEVYHARRREHADRGHE